MVLSGIQEICVRKRTGWGPPAAFPKPAGQAVSYSKPSALSRVPRMKDPTAQLVPTDTNNHAATITGATIISSSFTGLDLLFATRP